MSQGVLYSYTCDMWFLKSPICDMKALYSYTCDMRLLKGPICDRGIVQLHIRYVVIEEPHMLHEGILQTYIILCDDLGILLSLYDVT